MTIYEEIAEERARQDAKWGGAEHDDQHSMSEWFTYVVEHAVRAVRDSSVATFRYQMVRVAALAVAAIEQADRHAKQNQRGA